MSGHTPGPWTSELTRAGSSLVIQDHEGSIIAEVCQWKASPDQSAKDEPPLNAKLIAAAPDLLEALELVTNIYAAMRESLSVKYPEDGWSAEAMSIDQARKAIARAKGESQ